MSDERILKRLDGLIDAVAEIDKKQAVLIKSHEVIADDVSDIKVQTHETNGRVGVLEKTPALKN